MNTSSNGSSNKVYSSNLCVLNSFSTKSTVTEVTEATMYTDVQVRGLKKLMFRRLTSKLNILKALDSRDDAKSVLVELKKAFTAFQEAHDVVCAPITDFGEQMKEEQEFIDVQLQYTQCLNDIISWLYGDNSDVSYAKPSLAINSSAVNAFDTGKSQGDTINCGKQSICLLCPSVHPLYACGVFKKKSINQRLAFVAHHKLCCICFSKEHATINCPADIVCKKCSLNHSTYIHVDDVIVNKDVDVNTVTPVDIPTNSSGTTLASNSADDTPSSDYTFMPTVSVVVNESYKTYALLDSGSTNSFITSDAVKCLGLSGKTVIYRHSTVDTLCMTTSTKVVNFILYSLDGSKSLTMSNVFVVEEVPYTYSPCRDLSIYPHLSDVLISPVYPPAKVDLLIGQDNSEALVPLQVLKGNPGDPFGVLTKFGWTLNSVVPGSSPDCVSHCVVSNFVHTSINAKVEVLGDTADDHVDPTQATLKSLSVSTDCKVLDICYGESDPVDGHVDLPIPQEVSHLDNNFPVVLSNCYKPLLTSVGKISNMSDCVDDMNAIICKGLAEDIPVDVVQNHDPMTCFVPYHPVVKRSGDIYFLSDYSNSSQEYSFDDCLFHMMDSTLDAVFHDASLYLSYTNDCPLSVISTDETSNLVIKPESVLSFYGFDPTKCFVYHPPMSRLIPDFNLSLDVDAIVSAHSQLVSKALGILWAMPLKQWLSWLKSFGSWINNTCPMLCCQFVLDNG